MNWCRSSNIAPSLSMTSLNHVILILSWMAIVIRGDLTEVCNSNHFEGRCLEDEVIIIETAQYGRLQIGRCMTETLGYINCVNDVTTIAETHCSGKRKCSVRVDDSMFLGSNPPCNPEVKNHLWISYSCQKVIVPTTNCLNSDNKMRTVIHLNDYMSTHLSSSSSSSSSSSKIIQAFLTSTPRTATTKTPLHPDNAKQQRTQKIKLFLSSAISEQTGCGLSENPWVLMAGPGQRINITVIDFSQESLQLPEPMDNKRVYSSQNPTHKQMDKSRNRTSEFTCRVLANIRESSFDGISTVCSGQGKVVNVKTSTSNKVELRFHGNRVLSDGSGSGSVGAGGIAKPAIRLHSHFLFQIEVLGCATPTYPAPMTAKRIGDLLMVECNKGGASGGGTGWTLTCINDVWIGNHGNCSHASSTIAEKLENLFPYATSVVTIGVIAVFMVCLILTAGVFCIKWRLRHDINQLQQQQQQQQQQISKSAHGSFDPLYDYSSTSIQQQQQHLTDERKYPLLQSTDGGRLATYYPTIPTPTDNLNEYATMRLLQNEQLIANPNRARKYNQDGVFPGEPAGMMVVANQTGAPCGNYRYPPRTMVSTFLTTSDVPYTFGKNISQDGTNYKNDHIYESPDIVKEEVDKLVQKSSFQVPPPPPSQASSALKTRPQFPVGVHDVAKRNDDVSCGVGAFRSSARKMEHQTSLVSNENEGGAVGD